MLRVFAAKKMLCQHKIQCCRAAGKPAVRTKCSKDLRSNSQIAGQTAHLPTEGGCWLSRLWLSLRAL